MNAPGSATDGCAGHARVAPELRSAAELVAQWLQPWLERMAQSDVAGQPGPAGSACAWCPVCALIAALRGERPELTGRLAEHVAGLLAVARELLTPPGERVAGEHTQDVDSSRRAPSRRVSVQHVTVRPAAPGGSGAAGG
ncbi:MAG TPA: hypothetical protein VIY28_05210 [Pseudonocardiaceae bacterium]